jgi:hypothetical protein
MIALDRSRCVVDIRKALDLPMILPPTALTPVLSGPSSPLSASPRRYSAAKSGSTSQNYEHDREGKPHHEAATERGHSITGHGKPG